MVYGWMLMCVGECMYTAISMCVCVCVLALGGAEGIGGRTLGVLDSFWGWPDGSVLCMERCSRDRSETGESRVGRSATCYGKSPWRLNADVCLP